MPRPAEQASSKPSTPLPLTQEQHSQGPKQPPVKQNASAAQLAGLQERARLWMTQSLADESVSEGQAQVIQQFLSIERMTPKHIHQVRKEASRKVVQTACMHIHLFAFKSIHHPPWLLPSLIDAACGCA
jgi:hypothetical protein